MEFKKIGVTKRGAPMVSVVDEDTGMSLTFFTNDDGWAIGPSLLNIPIEMYKEKMNPIISEHDRKIQDPESDVERTPSLGLPRLYEAHEDFEITSIMSRNDNKNTVCNIRLTKGNFSGLRFSITVAPKGEERHAIFSNTDINNVVVNSVRFVDTKQYVGVIRPPGTATPVHDDLSNTHWYSLIRSESDVHAYLTQAGIVRSIQNELFDGEVTANYNLMPDEKKPLLQIETDKEGNRKIAQEISEARWAYTARLGGRNLAFFGSVDSKAVDLYTFALTHFDHLGTAARQESE